jgi:general secretion pathway protein I
MNTQVERRGQAGFTLLEVLIAFAILSVAVVAVIQGFAQGLRLLKVAGDHQQAVLLADQKTREMVTPIEGRDQGKEGNYDWERTVTVVPAPDLTRTQATAKWRVYQIDVKVTWGDKRGVEIVSMRTSAETPASGTTTGPPRTVGTVSTPGTSTTPGTRSTPGIPMTPSMPMPSRPTR